MLASATVALATLATALSSGAWADLGQVEKLEHASARVPILPTDHSNCGVGEFGGTRNEMTGRSTCLRCPPGKYQPLPLQTKCDTCPHGKYQPYGWRGVRQICLACPAGRVAMGDQKRCRLADRSTLRTADGCSAGKFWVKPRSANDTPCSECPAGKFQPLGGQLSCLRCPAGRSSAPRELQCSINTPAPTPRLPMCKRGQYVHKRTVGLLGFDKGVLSRSTLHCRACPKGTYQPNAARSSKCWACPRGQASTDQRVDCISVKRGGGGHTPAPTPWAAPMQHVVIRNGDEVPNDYEKFDKRRPLGSHYSAYHSEDAATAAVQPVSGDDDWLDENAHAQATKGAARR